jgi:hypothetical protein
MSDWNALTHELDQWEGQGRTATFWWRDDDAGPDDGLLDGFLAQRQALGVPLALATVPAWLEERSAAALRADSGCRVLQHGVNHTDRTRGDRRKMELCDEALPTGLADAITQGKNGLETALGPRFLPVMVPPWNRVDPGVEFALVAAGLAGLSTLGPRKTPTRSGLYLANVHIDLIDWKTDRAFAGESRCLSAAIDHLSARRRGEADADEPTGLMTHHRVHDTQSRSCVDRFVAFVRDHPRARWLDASDVFFPDGKKS